MSEKIFGISSQTANAFLQEDDNRSLITNNIIITPESLRVITRPECEKDEKYRHFATYAIIQDTEGKIFVYPRASGSAEARLHGKWSIGVGGHVNINNFKNIDKLGNASVSLTDAMFYTAMLREISEELFGLPEKEDDINRMYFTVSDDNKINLSRIIAGQSTNTDVTSLIYSPITYLFDNSNEVGKRHIAVITRYVISPEEFSKLAITQETKGHRWMTLDEIREEKSKEDGLKLESWSNILIDNFDILNGNNHPNSAQYGEAPFNNGPIGNFLKV